jgi:hypothetical protein
MRNGSDGGMEEYLLHLLLHLVFTPVGVLQAERRSLELSGFPVETESRLPFLPR